MNEAYKCVQGDNIAFDYSSDDVDFFDGNWTGKWAIVDMLGDGRTSFASGTLALSDDLTALEMRVTPADTEAVPVGDYYLVVEITNAVLGYNREVEQLPLEIAKQGISAA